MIRLCPNCGSQRPVAELFCEGEIAGDPCGWDLSQEPIRSPDDVLPPPPTESSGEGVRQCANGHAIDAGDLLCPICGIYVDGSAGVPPPDTDPIDLPAVPGWRLVRALTAAGSKHRRYEAESEADGRRALLTIYEEGQAPDSDVYAVLRSMPREHAPAVIDAPRIGGRFIEITEWIDGGTLAELPHATNPDALAAVARELGGAIHQLAEAGVRHRDLRPGTVLVRTRDPLDLVLAGFGAATLSQSDLDIIAPLETTRYTAPEAIAGGVTAAGDWWSLGMILLERATAGACFQGVNDHAFLIHVIATGAPIPVGLDPRVDLLLRGLLAHDRQERWSWSEVSEWLAGGSPPAPARPGESLASGPTIALGGVPYKSPARLAIAAAQAAHWDDALNLWRTGGLVTWAEEAKLSPQTLAELSTLQRVDDVDEDLKLAIALKLVNPALPLTIRGTIIGPGWLLEDPEAGYRLLAGPAPDILARQGSDLWLARLKARAAQVRQRAKQLDIALDEGALRVNVLATSRTRLAAVWGERRKVLPDTDHAGLTAILERRQIAEEDLILLLSASIEQFRTADAIVAEAAEAAQRAGIEQFDAEAALTWLERPRREIFAAIDDRLTGFARSGLALADEWADQFRLERRLTTARALALLAVPPDQWRAPTKSTYIATILDFFAKRITGAVMRGPLTRFIIGKTTPRLDVMELGTQRRPAQAVVEHLLLRNGQPFEIDPAAFDAADGPENRLRTLYSHASLYRRDTGIDGLYMGFPFLLLQESRGQAKPRIAPILLWPLKLQPELGARGRVVVAFDREREEVRINPAFEPLLGAETTRLWTDIARELLGRSSLSVADVMDAFALRGVLEGRELTALPSKDVIVEAGKDRIACAAAFFHLAFIGQAVMEDMRGLKGRPVEGTSLETMLRVSEPVANEISPRGPELDRYFTAASDPSQERAVLQARSDPGLLIEGPPGTGKSQTIVNIVADAIGRNRSLLVVCQKQAALDVVRKRLEAEGLANRIMMVTDVNRDRRQVIQSVRDQLDKMWAQPINAGAGWRRRRQEVAARIEALEGELDRHHESLHRNDDRCGLSYRQILADLIALEEGGPPIEAPFLRRLLAPLDVSAVATLQETCGPLARLWLPARFEGSGLAPLRQFSAEAGTVQAFAADFAAFIQAERNRADVLAATGDARRIDDPEPFAAWKDENASLFRALDAELWVKLSRWIDLCPSLSDRQPADRALHEAGEVAAGLALTQTSPNARAEEVAEGLSDDALATAASTLKAVLQDPSLLDRLMLAPFRRRRRARAWLKAHGLAEDAVATAVAAMRREIGLRPWRQRAIALLEKLGEPTPPTGTAPSALEKTLLGVQAELSKIADLAMRLHACPAAGDAVAMAREGSSAAFDSFMTTVEQGLERHEARALSRAALEGLKPWFEPGWIDRREAAITGDGDSVKALQRIAESRASLQAYQRYRIRAAQLEPLATELFAALRAVSSGLDTLPEADLDGVVRRIIGRESRLAWRLRLEGERSELALDAQELGAKATALAEADREMRKLNGRLLAEGIDVTKLGRRTDWEDVTRLQGQRARRLREFFDRGQELGLMTLRPVWLMNPDVASRLLPLRAKLFDAIVYDEASQMPVEYALSTLYRASRAIVSGDEKQMPPTAFFTSRVESDEADGFDRADEEGQSEEEREEQQETWNRREIKDCPDLLQLAKSVLPSTTLEIHYRSVYRELIQFSNAAFYLNRLSVPARHPDDEIRRIQPIEMVRVDGVYSEQVNAAEAARVVELLKSAWRRPPAERRSTGVVTFNRKQADLIEEVLEEAAEEDADFREALAQERDRIEGGEDMGFFVKNVENVQGDERDVMIFSSTFGRNAQGTFRRNFGVLGQQGGERRLNVAVTRARAKVILVTSMPIALISDLLSTRRRANTPRDHLQAYFEYARALSEGEFDTARALLRRFGQEKVEAGRDSENELDGFQRSVADFVISLGHAPTPISEPGPFGLDFALIDPRSGLYGFGIECDPPAEPLLRHARAREMWRPTVLTRSVPRIHRVSSQGWYQDGPRERRRLADALAEAFKREAAE